MKITLQSPIAIYSDPIPVKMNVAIDGHFWDVEGVYDIRTNEFTPQLVGSYGVEQFAKEANSTVEEFTAKVQNIFNKNRGW